ncbi:MAG TPA: hypothetical protein VHH09_01000 [Acidimicrobiales bacterium]|nr:hypothetical protein [Acidimicrobiales bacterium]
MAATGTGATKKAATTRGAAAKAGKPTKAAKAARFGKRRGKPGAPRIRAWEEDPGMPDSGMTPVLQPVPDVDARPLAVSITGPKPPPGLADPTTAEFRWWTAAEALRRGADMWSAAIPGLEWFHTVGPALEVELDAGEDLNAYYDRSALRFFHGTAGTTVVYSGESPDIVCHELGHAVLDALRPQLFDVAFIEAGAFHESFGDISAILAALQLRSVREEATAGRIYRTSRLSRVAEQLGWAIRLVAPQAVDPDCLRNAVNSFFYKPPETLPPSAPANELSSEVHSFSRVFTGAFFDALSAMFDLQDDRDQQSLLQTATDAASLLVDAISASPLVPSYFSQLAAHMIEADADRFGGRYTDALDAAFLRHGVLSPEATCLVASSRPPPAAVRVGAAAATDGAVARDYVLAVSGHPYGLDEDLLVPAPAETKRFAVAGAAAEAGSVESPSHSRAAEAFVEDLFRRDKIDLGGASGRQQARSVRPTKRTHEVRREERGLVLARRFFD